MPSLDPSYRHQKRALTDASSRLTTVSTHGRWAEGGLPSVLPSEPLTAQGWALTQAQEAALVDSAVWLSRVPESCPGGCGQGLRQRPRESAQGPRRLLLPAPRLSVLCILGHTQIFTGVLTLVPKASGWTSHCVLLTN